MNLSGKRVLFFGPQTFGYEVEIAKALTDAGASVVYRNDKPNQSFLAKAVGRLFPKLLWIYSNHVFEHWLEAQGPKQCDIVFVVKGEGLSPAFIDSLRKRYPQAVFVLYLWDSIRNLKLVEQKIPKFDFAYSFDPVDCQEHENLRHRPLFYLSKFLEKSPPKGSGCFFIGTLNGDRPAVIARVAKALPQGVDFDYWLFVRSTLELSSRKIIDSTLGSLDKLRLLHKPMTTETIREKFNASAAILDIEHPNQNGLTMRTFEVLASGKKLITTNKNISNYEFFDPDRICVVDRANPRLHQQFFANDPKPLPGNFYQKYSLNGWLEEILGGDRLQTIRDPHAKANV